jgi:hypothetical protein
MQTVPTFWKMDANFKCHARRPQRIASLFELLMDFMGSKYLDIAMDTYVMFFFSNTNSSENRAILIFSFLNMIAYMKKLIPVLSQNCGAL